MDTKTLTRLRSLLLSNQAKLQQQLSDADAATGIVTLDQTTVGRVSRMDALQQQSMAVSTKTKAESSLRSVVAALRRIEDEDYGFCNRCDEEIEVKRLEVQPEASHCLSCQNQLDQG